MDDGCSLVDAAVVAGVGGDGVGGYCNHRLVQLQFAPTCFCRKYPVTPQYRNNPTSRSTCSNETAATLERRAYWTTTFRTALLLRGTLWIMADANCHESRLQREIVLLVDQRCFQEPEDMYSSACVVYRVVNE